MSATTVALAAAETGCSGAGPGVSNAGSSAPPAPPHAEIEEVSLADLSALMQRGEITSEALVAAYGARIAAIDRSGPTLRSVLELNPDAAAIARALDDERRLQGPRGPLHGVPILLKDNIDTGDRTHTTAGSLALADAPASADAHLVALLRKAGAVILGKTNLSEWANIRSDHSTSGWSARGGLTKNPYALDRNTSGSSSGSAAAVASNLCAVAIGTETDGSIVSPSSICGVVGMKPTVGLVSRTGIVPISRSQDTAGPMTRSVADAALLLAAIDAALAKHQLDALMAPTGGVAWMTDLVYGDNYTGSSSTPAAVAGYPSITVPAGAVSGLPFGVSFFGPAWSEPSLLAIAFAFEQQTKASLKPTFPPTVNAP